MSKNKIQSLAVFEKSLKKLAKKFKTLPSEVGQLVDLLMESPETGTNMGSGLYKIRLASKSKGGGKRGGFRVITYLIDERDDGTDIYLMTIYDKSDISDIPKKDLLELAKSILGE